MDIIILIVLVIGGSFATFLLAIWLTSMLKKVVSKDGRGSSGGAVIVAAVAEEAVAEGNHPQPKRPPHSTLSESGALTIKSVLL